MSTMSLVDHVRSAAETAGKVRQQQGHELMPMLHVVSGGQITIVGLHIRGGGHDVVWAARTTILQMQPEHAVLMFESWTHRKGLPESDPDMRALLAGALRPAQLPPHKQGTALTVIGESADGTEATALYYLEDDGHFSELGAFSDEDARASGGRVEFVTHMRPLFVDRDLMRRIPPDERAELVELLGSEKKLEHLVNRAARKFVQDLGPRAEPHGYHERMDERFRQVREQIGWRKGGAR